MAQWPFVSPGIKIETPVTIPEEWQKANQALQAVQKPKTSTSPSPTTNSSTTTTNSIKQTPVVNYPLPYAWQSQPVYGYSGFPNYPPFPNYGYYAGYQNYNNCTMMNNRPMFMPTMPMPVRMPQPPQGFNNDPLEASSPDKKLEGAATSNTNEREKTSTPPPPPSPQSESNNNNRNFNSNKKAPGVEGIKFNLPKKFQKQHFPYKNNNNNDKPYSKYKNSFRHDQQKPHDFKNNQNSSPMKKNQNNSYALSQDEWPDSLRRYAQESFLKCKSDVDKDQVEIILKGKLVKASRDGTILTKNWDSEPLPSIHSERMQKESEPVKIQKAKSPQSSPRHFQEKSKNYSGSEQRNYPRRTRSPSWSPPTRNEIRRKRYSRSSSSESSSGSRESKKHILSSRVISPTENKNAKKFNSPKYKQKKKKNKQKMLFTVDAEFSTNEALQKRAARFDYATKKGHKANIVLTINNPFIIDELGDFMEWGTDAVIGTCQDLEKPFLRLTGAVDPSTVRPEDVLVKSLKLVKESYSKSQEYNFACEQLKSIRQDLVVQCIRNKFTVEVYETHARIALEKGDKTEFNQCQSQLKSLYKETGIGNKLEFTGYHILYNLFTEDSVELKNILSKLTAEDKKNEVVSHALKITTAWSLNNYHRFFKLYLSAPMMSGFVIDWFIERIRKSALKACIKSYRPTLPVSFFEKELAFSSSEELTTFLAQAELVYADATTINCKESCSILTSQSWSVDESSTAAAR